ncbi:hypothetical protein SAMD00019534_016360 [Acytostelium subglobosum LB1]|uniref:hypothetical protein n=1 Tax=Acytostelium subglobosum LB1 TaxID=1410327 RepID=UPI000644F4E3|nr:hypothetical protein SAMD00019534_016360 [Acytostelium subglobosum LB1]GAM18461.1 hypothetical protein SAMD00019534_016360 [Acytostelium subglobosum LB1]|eukprot:XP_012757681.1 hypothetical protein SAMD00019534_016360 [Acytostelium subglobosum LB1]
MSFWQNIHSQQEEATIDYDDYDEDEVQIVKESDKYDQIHVKIEELQRSSQQRDKDDDDDDNVDEYDEDEVFNSQQQRQQQSTKPTTSTTSTSTTSTTNNNTQPIKRPRDETTSTEHNDVSIKIKKSRIFGPPNEVKQEPPFDVSSLRPYMSKEADEVYSQLFQLPLRWPVYDRKIRHEYSEERVLPHNLSDLYLDLLQDNITHIWDVIHSENKTPLMPNMVTVLSMMSCTFLTDLLDNIFYHNELTNYRFSKSVHTLIGRTKEVTIEEVIRAARAIDTPKKSMPVLNKLASVVNDYNNLDNKIARLREEVTEPIRQLFKPGWKVKVARLANGFYYVTPLGRVITEGVKMALCRCYQKEHSDPFIMKKVQIYNNLMTPIWKAEKEIRKNPAAYERKNDGHIHHYRFPFIEEEGFRQLRTKFRKYAAKYKTSIA